MELKNTGWDIVINPMNLDGVCETYKIGLYAHVSPNGTLAKVCPNKPTTVLQSISPDGEIQKYRVCESCAIAFFEMIAEISEETIEKQNLHMQGIPNDFKRLVIPIVRGGSS